MALPASDACDYCSAAVPSAAGHDETCPTVTDLWPVTPSDLHPPMICPICLAKFSLGEVYTTVPSKKIPSSERLLSVVAICLGCAALNRETSL